MDRWIACQFGDLKYLKEEIAKLWWWQKSSYLNLGDAIGQWPLIIAARQGQSETVKNFMQCFGPLPARVRNSSC